MFLTRTSCRKTTHANGYYGAWPGWAVSINVLPLTILLWLCITYIYESVNFEAEMFGPEEEEFFQGVGKASSRQ